MKINFRVLLAVILVVGLVLWAADSIRTRTYSGSDTNFGIGTGTITIRNGLDEPIPARFVGTGTRTFAVTSDAEGIEGNSTREGAGRSATQVFAFELPPGATDFTVARGSNVVFQADGTVEASVQPLGADETRSTILFTGVLLLGTLYYISHVTGHRWITSLRNRAAPGRSTGTEQAPVS